MLDCPVLTCRIASVTKCTSQLNGKISLFFSLPMSLHRLSFFLSLYCAITINGDCGGVLSTRTLSSLRQLLLTHCSRTGSIVYFFAGGTWGSSTGLSSSKLSFLSPGSIFACYVILRQLSFGRLFTELRISAEKGHRELFLLLADWSHSAFSLRCPRVPIAFRAQNLFWIPASGDAGARAAWKEHSTAATAQIKKIWKIITIFNICLLQMLLNDSEYRRYRGDDRYLHLEKALHLGRFNLFDGFKLAPASAHPVQHSLTVASEAAQRPLISLLSQMNSVIPN